MPLGIRDRYGLFVGGDWIDPASGQSVATINPATEQTLAEISVAAETDVDRAVRAARRGYEKYWRKLRPEERAKYLYRLSRAIAQHARELAGVEAADTGKPIAESNEFDVPAAVARLFYYAGWADKLEWSVPSALRARPVGVVAAILPSRSALALAASRIAPALACGNTVVLKPSETTSLCALHLASLALEADLPPGVLNVVTGDARTGATLAEHPELDLLSFTGTAETGAAVRRAAAGTRMRLSMDLAGRPCVVIHDDAPLDQAVEGIVAAAYLNRGPGGCSGARLIVHESLAAELTERLLERIDNLRLGDPLDVATDVGPLTTRAARDHFNEFVRSSGEDGATLAEQHIDLPPAGFYVRPALIHEVAPSSRVAGASVAGPLATLTTFRTPDEAVTQANAVPFGSTAGVWSDSGALALYTAQRLAAGTVWCNAFDQFDACAPFGGFNQSGFGREGGIAGLLEYIAT